MSLLNGCTSYENNDYRMFVIGNFPELKYLDDCLVTADERNQAKSYRYLCGLATALNFIEKFGLNRIQSTRKRSNIEIFHS